MFPNPENIFLTPRNEFLVNYFQNVTKLVNPMDSLAKTVFDNYNLKGYDGLQTATNIYSFMTEHIAYKMDDVAYWQSPTDTIRRQVGDCEDHAILESTFFEMGGLVNNYFVITYNVTWREYHIANMVFLPPSKSSSEKYLYLDSSYPHKIGALPFYADKAFVYGFFSTRNPHTNPLLTAFPQPFKIFLDNAALNTFMNFQ